MSGEYLVETADLKKYFKTAKGMLQAVDKVDIRIARGETLGLVGESGCGKSTLGRVLIRLLEKTSGDVRIDGVNIFDLPKEKLREFRKNAQMVFQDPYSSINPRLSVDELISEPLRIHKVYPDNKGMTDRVRELMDTVGLAKRLSTSYPHELDGGRRQRIGIARALALKPEFIVLDEPVSALDVSIQAQILNLLQDLKDEAGFTYLFISHNLSVVKHISDRIAVMYLGKIIELSDRLDIFENPLHPYTQALLSAIPIARMGGERRDRIILEGDVPSPINPPKGCRFYGRCPSRQPDCAQNLPELKDAGAKHFVACFHPGPIRGGSETGKTENR